MLFYLSFEFTDLTKTKLMKPELQLSRAYLKLLPAGEDTIAVNLRNMSK